MISVPLAVLGLVGGVGIAVWYWGWYWGWCWWWGYLCETNTRSKTHTTKLRLERIEYPIAKQPTIIAVAPIQPLPPPPLSWVLLIKCLPTYFNG